jgi:hypothetical protein
MGNSHGELLSAHEINQTSPGALKCPKVATTLRRPRQSIHARRQNPFSALQLRHESKTQAMLKSKEDSKSGKYKASVNPELLRSLRLSAFTQRRRTMICFDPSYASDRCEREVMSVIAHELAHAFKHATGETRRLIERHEPARKRLAHTAKEHDWTREEYKSQDEALMRKYLDENEDAANEVSGQGRNLQAA